MLASLDPLLHNLGRWGCTAGMGNETGHAVYGAFINADTF